MEVTELHLTHPGLSSPTPLQDFSATTVTINHQTFPCVWSDSPSWEFNFSSLFLWVGPHKSQVIANLGIGCPWLSQMWLKPVLCGSHLALQDTETGDSEGSKTSTSNAEMLFMSWPLLGTLSLLFLSGGPYWFIMVQPKCYFLYEAFSENVNPPYKFPYIFPQFHICLNLYKNIRVQKNQSIFHLSLIILCIIFLKSLGNLLLPSTIGMKSTQISVCRTFQSL